MISIGGWTHSHSMIRKEKGQNECNALKFTSRGPQYAILPFPDIRDTGPFPPLVLPAPILAPFTFAVSLLDTYLARLENIGAAADPPSLDRTLRERPSPLGFLCNHTRVGVGDVGDGGMHGRWMLFSRVLMLG